MADVTLCTSEVCPHRLKTRCKRYTTRPDQYRQSYVDFTPYIKQIFDEGVSGWYWCMMQVPVDVENQHRRGNDQRG